MRYNPFDDHLAWLPFYIVTLATLVILFIIADVRLP